MLQSCNTTIDQLSTPDGGRIHYIKCPVHHGEDRNARYGWINGHPWAKCWSHLCDPQDILAALGLGNTWSPAWTPPPPKTISTANSLSQAPINSESVGTFDALAPVTPSEGRAYVDGVRTKRRVSILFQRNDGLRKNTYRAGKERWTDTGLSGSGWMVRRFNPELPDAAIAITLAEGEKDSALLAQAGFISFCAPLGAGNLHKADFTELADLATATGLPVVLAGDNDEAGIKAMLKVGDLLRGLKPIDTADYAPEKGSVADLHPEDLQSLIFHKLRHADKRWLKPARNRAMYHNFKCPRPKRRKKSDTDRQGVRNYVPCGNSGTCRQCAEWETFLHVERCWRGKPAQMVTVSGFGGFDSTIAQTTGICKTFREHFEGRLRKNSYVYPYTKNHTGERRNFMSALRIQDDYRAAFTMFFSIPLTEAQLAKERVRAGRSGLAFLVKDIVTRGDIEDAAPPALSINMEGVGLTNRTHTWSTSGWPAWEDLPSTYAFSDGVELKDDEAFPEDAIEEKQWRREHGQQWNPKMSLRDNLIQREFYAKTNATQWMSTCLGLNLETLQALDQASTIYEVDSLILEVGDYAGPKALLVDSAQYLVHGGDYRMAYGPVLAAAGHGGLSQDRQGLA